MHFFYFHELLSILKRNHFSFIEKMDKPKQITFRILLIQVVVSGIAVALLQHFWLDHNPNLGKTALFFIIFCSIYLIIMCLMYKINPLKGNFRSPYKD
ncbi:hypothetical protein A33Q_0421 [Indibacter alkaliphilus LW1]|uniref:Uncharacterized protein n=1 Tax=Indibacter alkaliphilus (strain CCUG 57479 / KCTC 22604 / LW1) TaxID=1189612 RepID=S2DR39_INDAL|nr:hypothetical protein A33Q_0421 [Indibacter alkaliphilus LW1]